ncbi:hypothetical protein O181_056792, partial [Austropuccinia psidii MF-1]|nr:hypothetical protein [Austropuccinia psidii MF-1]
MFPRNPTSSKIPDWCCQGPQILSKNDDCLISPHPTQNEQQYSTKASKSSNNLSSLDWCCQGPLVEFKSEGSLKQHPKFNKKRTQAQRRNQASIHKVRSELQLNPYQTTEDCLIQVYPKEKSNLLILPRASISEKSKIGFDYANKKSLMIFCVHNLVNSSRKTQELKNIILTLMKLGQNCQPIKNKKKIAGIMKRVGFQAGSYKDKSA